MTRKLATIQKITELNPIKGADRIECAKVLGWHCVVQKGDFNVGDLVVYCEIDSVLPDKPEFEFLRDSKFRIRTRKFKGQISQGLILPMSILDNIEMKETEEGRTFIKENDDVTELLGITKYEPPIPANLSGEVKRQFPTHLVPKTDEQRVQNLQPLLDRYVGEKCYITEKVDGCSCTIYYDIQNDDFGVCSRKLDLKENDNNSFWKCIKEMDIENKLKTYCQDRCKSYAIQGELVGNGIQSNKLKLNGVRILFFNIFDISKYQYLNFEEFKKAFKEMDLPTVPIINENYTLHNDIDKLVVESIETSELNKEIQKEGIVVRPLEEKQDLFMSNNFGSGRVSFKVINPKYLLKYGE